MARMKRTPFEREHDLEQITRWYLRGDTQTEIAARLGLSQKQISYDLNTIRQRWRKETTFNLDEHKAKELARIDETEREYWQAWERSKKRRTKRRKETSLNDVKFTVEREQRDGNPAFLAGVMTCIDRRCKLLGLDAPTRTDSRSLEIDLSKLTNDQLERVASGEDVLQVIAHDHIAAARQSGT